MSSAEEYQAFKQSVFLWKQLSESLTEKNDEIKKIRATKNDAENKILEYMSNHNALDKPIKLSKDGKDKIIVSKKRDYGTLTFSYVEECLEKILSKREEVDYILDYLHNNREVRETACLRFSAEKAEK